MDKEEIVEALKSYRSYKYAVNRYERHRQVASAGIANYSAMPGGSGAPELFFDRVGKAADMGRTSFQDQLDYQVYKNIVTEIDGALGVLTEDERHIIVLKWMEDVTLKQIATRKGYSEQTIKRTHTRAIGKLSKALRFAQFEHIESHESSRIVDLIDSF